MKTHSLSLKQGESAMSNIVALYSPCSPTNLMLVTCQVPFRVFLLGFAAVSVFVEPHDNSSNENNERNSSFFIISFFGFSSTKFNDFLPSVSEVSNFSIPTALFQTFL
jgi:hypothetical protein